ncbi:MAG: UbiA family prenyltransferase [Candidatus Methanoperedens sp.]|nr:UbiA family prenyltransferase [Candidatus Methanoperedens sp.]
MGHAATLRVLGSSTINSISGGFRLYTAFILAGDVPDLILCFAFSFVVYSVYTLDRALKSKEDEVNRPEERNADKNFVLIIVFAFLVTALLILIVKKISPFAALLPFVIGFLYTKGIKIGDISIKFKQGLGVKNFVVALTWAFTIVSFIYNLIENYLLGFLIFCFFFFKSFINTVLFDCKDIDGDSIAGLTTIPVYFGEKRTRIILQLINSLFHFTVAALVLSGMVAFDAIILAYSWVAGLIYISLYANSKKTIFRSVIVHGEWIHMLAFRNFAIQFFGNAFHSS